jgi:hypothetical protein
MIIIGSDVVERYFAAQSGHRGIKAALGIIYEREFS